MRVFLALLAAIVLTLASAILVFAQDPAQGSWQAWAAAQCPSGTHMTHYEAQWTVPNLPSPNNCFYSPWIGSDTTDNLNLIQPVNPMINNEWVAYSEYFQWSPEYNHNSEQFPTQPGHRLRGEMTFLGESRQAYRILQTDLNTGSSSSQVVPVQKDNSGNYKKYTWLYAVWEKPCMQCSDYPPEGKIVFEDIKVFCSGQQVFPKWSTDFFQNNCDIRAHVINNNTLSVTWNTQNDVPATAGELKKASQTGMKKP